MKVAILFLLSLFTSHVAANDVAREDIAAIFKPWDSPSTPGCAAGVEKEGVLIFSQAFGSADLELDVANEMSTLFEVGSVTKQFTAAAILILARDGKLKLSDDIRKYLPEMPDYGDVITVDHLLTHTSGLRDWGVLDEMTGWGRTTRAMNNADAFRTIVRQRKLDFRPGDEFSYTNSGFVLLAIIVERITGQSLQDFSKDIIFDPLGMASTQWRENFRVVVKGRSVAYMNTSQGYVQTMPFENVYGDAGILTSVKDLLTWNSALSDRKFGDYVSAEFERAAVLNNGRKSSYARGLWVRTRNGAREVSHAGGIGAYRAWLARFPEHELSIAVVCNAGDPDYTFGGDYFGYKIADLFLPASPTSGTAVMYQANAAARAGLYVSQLTGMPVNLKQNGDELTFNGSVLSELSAERMAMGNGNQLIFENSDSFRVETESGNVDTYKRASPWLPSNAELEGLNGHFYSSEIDTTYEIRQEGSGLIMYISNRPEIFFPLVAAYRDAFVYDTRLGKAGGLVRFYRDGSGNVTELSIGWRIGRVRDLRFELVKGQ